MKNTILAVSLFAASIPVVASGQYTNGYSNNPYASTPRTNISSQRLGNFRYDTGTLNNQPYNATGTRIGNFDYYNGSVGGQQFDCTTTTIGKTAYTNCN